MLVLKTRTPYFLSSKKLKNGVLVSMLVLPMLHIISSIVEDHYNTETLVMITYSFLFLLSLLIFVFAISTSRFLYSLSVNVIKDCLEDMENQKQAFEDKIKGASMKLVPPIGSSRSIKIAPAPKIIKEKPRSKTMGKIDYDIADNKIVPSAIEFNEKDAKISTPLASENKDKKAVKQKPKLLLPDENPDYFAVDATLSASLMKCPETPKRFQKTVSYIFCRFRIHYNNYVYIIFQLSLKGILDTDGSKNKISTKTHDIITKLHKMKEDEEKSTFEGVLGEENKNRKYIICNNSVIFNVTIVVYSQPKNCRFVSHQNLRGDNSTK